MCKFKRELPFLILIFTVRTVLGQSSIDFDHYELIKSSGNLPKDVTTTSTEKYKKSLEKISKKKISHKEKKTQREFQMYVNFSVDEILLSGLVLYNDPLGDYVNKVAQTVLKEQGNLSNEMRFYVVRFPYVNAFTTNSGIVFVTIGLLSHIENEAQLALILCHEIQHYAKEHSYKGFKHQVQLEKDLNKKSSGQDFDKFIKKTAYSRDLETEADEEGLELYKESGYSFDAIESMFDVLQFANLPFDEKRFSASFLETKNLKFPNSYIPSDSVLTPLDINSDAYDDELSTHPNIKKRRERLLALAAKMKPAGNSLFLNGEKEFFDMRKVARYEYIHVCLVQQKYEEAFVSLYLLMAENPNSHYLQKCLNHCLYAMSKLQVHYGATNYYSMVHTSYKTIEGSGGGSYYFLGRLIKSDVGLVSTALERMWEYHKVNPNDKNATNLIEDLTKTFVAKYNLDFDALKNIDPAKPIGSKGKKSKITKSEKKQKKEKKVEVEQDDSDEDINATKDKNQKGTTKEKKIKKKKKSKKNLREEFNEEEIRTESRPVFYSILKALAADEEYAKLYKKLYKEKKNIQKKKANEDEEESTIKKEEYMDIEYKAFDTYELDESVAIDKMVMVAPFYIKLNHNKKDDFRFESSENKVIKLSEDMNYVAKKIDMPIDDINTKTLKENDAEKLNEMYLINNFLNESSTDPEFSLIPVDKTEIDGFIANHGTQFILKLGVIGVKEEIDKFELACAIGVLLLGGSNSSDNSAVNVILKNHNYTYLLSNVIDLKTGQSVYSRVKMFNARDKEIRVKTHLYELLYHIKTKK
ncbi:MAG: M48 family metalloprotease [Bacteroidota bacterium]|nr:M48 family metalloprotease [Bacteroidota bacterium]